MPDLFASRVAAQEDPTADASIVNVTGSNSVNVFLGLGLPWTLASIYWETAGKRTTLSPPPPRSLKLRLHGEILNTRYTKYTKIYKVCKYTK